MIVNNLIDRHIKTWDNHAKSYRGVNDDKANMCERFVSDLKKLKNEYKRHQQAINPGLFGDNKNTR